MGNAFGMWCGEMPDHGRHSGCNGGGVHIAGNIGEDVDGVPQELRQVGHSEGRMLMGDGRE